ncbi:N-acetyl-gamma-glutamyl-phosphate reductase [Sulfobacillus sp. hq2]|uniref:N-acetyl-gamma-glutamyl-phosphate reductase n=1 Tax=Sulfobacillus TaxID=28033 RepID=UPI000CD14AA6|nr:N-acetyl-gamma-glutamyl-phosphate reductase [Sulfobacillus sp. hq2]POB10604.1 N-acetyl-gamma-glutamyl-phosphate reductase [Sulfobacillus sp. hq2]
MRAAVVGATGYAGQEIVRIIMRHPTLSLVAVTSEREAGLSTDRLFPFLRGGPKIFVSPDQLEYESFDIIFSCQGAKQATPLFTQWLERGVKIMDLSADFRFVDQGIYETAYGSHPAPDLLRLAQTGYADELDITYAPDRPLFGNPGCYPTGFYLAVGPLVAAGLACPLVIVDGKSGVSGAGRKPQVHLMMGEMAENVAPYNNPGQHRHTFEMEAVTGGYVTFQPHLMPMARGMELSIYIPNCSWSLDYIVDCWHKAYDGNAFVDVLAQGQKPETQRVRGTNRAELAAAWDNRTHMAVLYVTLDNLGKGAAGQAVQHVNQWLGWPQTLGLE